MWWMMIVEDRMGSGNWRKGQSFPTPVPRRCAQCHKGIILGQKVWAFDHHVFDSPKCVEMWAAIRDKV